MNPCCRNEVLTVKGLQSRTLAQIWRSPVRKAGEPPEAEYRWLHRIADAAAADVRLRFLKAIEQIRGTVEEAKLLAAIETGSVDQVVAALGLDEKMAEALRSSLLPPLEDTVIESGRTAPAASMPKGAEIQMRFDLANPNTTRFLRSYEFDLIRQVSDDTRTAIRGVVQHAFQYGGHPKEQARQIKEMIGLTDNQTKAVQNFRQMLESGDRQALQRELRDRRFDPSLRRALGRNADAGLPKSKIDTMVSRYRDRMLQARATNIARTETINAAQAGQQMAWEQAADKGLLSRSTLKQGWLVTPDDRLCLICAAIPLLNPDGVSLGGYFATPVGPVKRPTVHPQCRCSLYLMAF